MAREAARHQEPSLAVPLLPCPPQTPGVTAAPEGPGGPVTSRPPRTQALAPLLVPAAAACEDLHPQQPIGRVLRKFRDLGFYQKHLPMKTPPQILNCHVVHLKLLLLNSVKEPPPIEQATSSCPWARQGLHKEPGGARGTAAQERGLSAGQIAQRPSGRPPRPAPPRPPQACPRPQLPAPTQHWTRESCACLQGWWLPCWCAGLTDRDRRKTEVRGCTPLTA